MPQRRVRRVIDIQGDEEWLDSTLKRSFLDYKGIRLKDNWMVEVSREELPPIPCPITTGFPPFPTFTQRLKVILKYLFSKGVFNDNDSSQT